MTSTTKSRLTAAQVRTRRASFFVSDAILYYGGVAAWPIARDAAMVAVYAALVHAGIDPKLARDAVDLAPRTHIWPVAWNIGGRPCHTRQDIRADLDYCDGGAFPDAIDFMRAMGAFRR